jgi:hypothetical protein
MIAQAINSRKVHHTCSVRRFGEAEQKGLVPRVVACSMYRPCSHLLVSRVPVRYHCRTLRHKMLEKGGLATRANRVFFFWPVKTVQEIAADFLMAAALGNHLSSGEVSPCGVSEGVSPFHVVYHSGVCPLYNHCLVRADAGDRCSSHLPLVPSYSYSRSYKHHLTTLVGYFAGSALVASFFRVVCGEAWMTGGNRFEEEWEGRGRWQGGRNLPGYVRPQGGSSPLQGGPSGPSPPQGAARPCQYGRAAPGSPHLVWHVYGCLGQDREAYCL